MRQSAYRDDDLHGSLLSAGSLFTRSLREDNNSQKKPEPFAKLLDFEKQKESSNPEIEIFSEANRSTKSEMLSHKADKGSSK